MATNIPVPLLAKNLVSINVYAGDQSGNAITWSSPVDLGYKNGSGAYDGFSISGRKELANVTPTDAINNVNVPARNDMTFDVSEIQAADGSTALAALAYGHDFVKVVALYRPVGATSGGTYMAAMGAISQADFAVNEATGKNIYRVSAAMIGYGFYTGSTLPTPFT